MCLDTREKLHLHTIIQIKPCAANLIVVDNYRNGATVGQKADMDNGGRRTNMKSGLFDSGGRTVLFQTGSVCRRQQCRDGCKWDRRREEPSRHAPVQSGATLNQSGFPAAHPGLRLP